MAAVVVVAAFAITPGREDEAIALFERVTDATHREPGCLKYAWARALDDPARFVVIERWQSEADLAAHSASSHLAEFRPAIAALSTAPPAVTRYAEVILGDAAKASL